MNIELKTGQSAAIRFPGRSDVVITVSLTETAVSVVSNMPDIRGRQGTVFEERFFPEQTNGQQEPIDFKQAMLEIYRSQGRVAAVQAIRDKLNQTTIAAIRLLDSFLKNG